MPKQTPPVSPKADFKLPAWVVRRHERHYRDSYFHLWADIILAVLLAGLVTTVVWLILWQPKPDFTLSARVLSSRVTSGQEQEFEIRYRNDEGNPIGAATLELDLPDYFVLKDVESAQAFDEKDLSIKLGDIEANSEGKIIVRGIVRGETGSQQSLGMNLTYQSESVRKQVLNALGYDIDGSALTMKLAAPDKAYTNVPVNISLALHNESEEEMKQIEIIFPSEGWKINGNEAIANGRLRIDSLADGTEQTIDFTAAPSNEGTHEFAVETFVSIDGASLKQSRVGHQVIIVGPGLAVAASVREAALASVSPTATIDIQFRNTTKDPISEVSFTVAGSSSFSVASIETSEASLSLHGTTASYALPVPAGESRTVSLAARLQREAVATNQRAAITVKVSYVSVGEKVEYAVATERVKLNSNLSLEAAGYYYGPQGDQLGIGPIPPKVDIPTTYWIILQVNNLGNDIENPEVTADLPANVVWSEQQSSTSGELTYSPVTKRILWRPGLVNKTGGNYRISFPVTIIPKPSEVGTVPKLVTNIKISGKDSFTGSQLEGRAGDITTDIQADRQSAGKGKVEPL